MSAALKVWGREEWIAFTRQVVSFSTPDREAWIVRIGEECHRAQQAGEPAGVMHASAKLTGTTCWCSPCVKARDPRAFT